jgi:acid phosphatase (class A)
MLGRLVLVLLFFATPVLAGEKPYVAAADLDLTVFLPMPVKAGSPEDKRQQGMVIEVQKAATTERIELAVADAKETVFDMYSRTLGEKFTVEALPKTTHMFERVGESEDAVVDAAKPFYGRARPFRANPEIKPLVRQSSSGSYPSGHATRVTAVAIILTSMIPEKRDLIWARAYEYAESRVVGGMHYREDLDAGYRAGSALAAVTMSNPEFRADYPEVRSELRSALGLR